MNRIIEHYSFENMFVVLCWMWLGQIPSVRGITKPEQWRHWNKSDARLRVIWLRTQMPSVQRKIVEVLMMCIIEMKWKEVYRSYRVSRAYIKRFVSADRLLGVFTLLGVTVLDSSFQLLWLNWMLLRLKEGTKRERESERDKEQAKGERDELSDARVSNVN